MKKLVLSLSTFALIAASIFVFASCEKEENTDKLNCELSSITESYSWNNFFATIEWENLLYNILQYQQSELPNGTFVSLKITDFEAQIETFLNNYLLAPCFNEELINNEDEYDAEAPMYCTAKIKTKNEKKFKKWVEKQCMKGKEISIDYVNGYWIGVATTPDKNQYHDDWQQK